MADYQFREVTLYDMSVTFAENQEPEDQEAFLKGCAGTVQEALLLHESTADLTAGTRTKSVHFLASQEELSGFVSLHRGKEPVAFPEKGQAVISEGLAEVLDIQVGDSVLLHMPDMDTLSVTVSGIFDNNVYHYVLVSMDTVLEQWGTTPSVNTAYVNVPENQAAQESATTVSRQADVLSVMLCQDIAQRVSSMMTRLNYIVALVVLSAAALAFIVMYNLTNINITERIREIATIKVLGFIRRSRQLMSSGKEWLSQPWAAPFGIGRRKAAACLYHPPGPGGYGLLHPPEFSGPAISGLWC